MSKSKQILNQIQNIALYLFFFSINFEVWDPFNTDGFFSVSKFTGWIYLLTIIPQINNFIKTDRIKAFLLPICSFFVLLTLVSLININPVSYSFFEFSIFQNIFLFLFLLNHERKEPSVLEKGMLAFALGSVALALLFYAGIGIEYEGGRVRIFGDNSNGIGLRMSISVTILFLAIVQNRLKLGKARYLFLLPIPVMLLLLVETGSRVAFISFALIFVAGVSLFKTKKIWGKISIFSIGSLALIYSWLFLVLPEIVGQRLLLTYEERDLAGRDVIWQELFPLIKDNPIVGVGITGYSYFTKLSLGTLVSPHNVILEVLCYTGIIGLVAYLLFIFRVFDKGYKKYKKDGLLLPLLLISPVVGMILSGQILVSKIGYVIFAYIVASSAFIPKPETLDSVPALNTYRNRSIAQSQLGSEGFTYENLESQRTK